MEIIVPHNKLEHQVGLEPTIISAWKAEPLAATVTDAYFKLERVTGLEPALYS